MVRKKIIAGNWKMNTTLPEGQSLAQAIVAQAGTVRSCDIVICPPVTHLYTISEVIKNSTICLGAQDVHWEKQGAYTGKVSCAMLQSVGVNYVIIGHSEQRTLFHETDETVNKKLKAVLGTSLFPILCIGETLLQRQNGEMEIILKTQIQRAYQDIVRSAALKTILAYEPVWAIGTGVNATSQQAQDAHRFIRSVLEELYDTELSHSIRILYGGSLKPENAHEILSMKDVDGGLIGGASLKAQDFIAIINSI